MKICPHCKAQISDAAAFCNSCGRNVNLAPGNDAPMPPQGNRNTAPSAAPAPGPGMPQGSAMPPQQGMPQRNGMPQNGPVNPNMGMNPGMAPNRGMNPGMNPGMAPNMGGPNPGMNQGMPPVRAPRAAMDPKKKKKILLIAGACGIGVIAIVIAVIVIISLSHAYRKPLNNIISALNSQKRDVSAFSGYDYYQISDLDSSCRSIFSKSDYFEVWEEDMSDYYQDLYEDLEDRFGDNVKFSIEWEDADPMKKGDIREINDRLEEIFDGDETDWDDDDAFEDFADYLENIKYGAELDSSEIKKLHDATASYIKKYKKVKVTDGYEVDVKITIKGRDDEKTLKLRNAKIIKMNDDWVFVDSGEKDSFSYGKYSTFGEKVMSDLSPYIR